MIGRTVSHIACVHMSNNGLHVYTEYKITAKTGNRSERHYAEKRHGVPLTLKLKAVFSLPSLVSTFQLVSLQTPPAPLTGDGWVWSGM